MPHSTELYLVLKAVNSPERTEAAPPVRDVLSDPPPPQGANASGPETPRDAMAETPPSPPPTNLKAIIDHRPPTPPPASAMAAEVSITLATLLSVTLDDLPLQPPRPLRIQAVTIYGSRAVALAWLKSDDGQEFAKDAQALHLLRVSADDNV